MQSVIKGQAPAPTFQQHATPVLMINRNSYVVVLVSFMATGSMHGTCVNAGQHPTTVDSPQVGDYRENWDWRFFDRLDPAHTITLANDPVPVAASPGVYQHATPPAGA